MIVVDTLPLTEAEKLTAELLKEVREIKGILNSDGRKDIPGNQENGNGKEKTFRVMKDEDARRVFGGVGLDIKFVSEGGEKEKESNDGKEVEKPDSPVRKGMERQLAKLANNLNLLGLINAVSYLQSLNNDPQCINK